MTSQYRHRRTSSPATAFPNPLEPGEIAVNTANRQLAVGDASSGAIGVPLPLVALRYFDARAIYAANDLVQNAAVVYRAKGAAGPGAFNPAQWDMLAGAVDPQYVAVAGDQMTGPLELPAAAPTLGVHATNKTYVDTALANKSSVIVSETPPAGVIDNTLWLESDTGLLFIRYNDGNTTQWVIACPQPDTSMFVARTGDTMTGPLVLPAAAPTLGTHAANKTYVDAGDAAQLNYTAQSLTAPQQAQARSNVYAAPLDALAYSGMQINGSMEVSQELGLGGRPTPGYVCDGWLLYYTGTMVLGAAQSGGVVPGQRNCIYMSVTTAQASLGAGHTAVFYQYIEGYRVSRLAWGTSNAQPITIGFWTKHHRTGIYSCVVRGTGGGARSYATTYTQAIADFAQYNTITIPGDTAGTWATDNTAAMVLLFSNGTSTTGTAPSANTWVAGNYDAAPGQVNGVASTSDIFILSGVVVLPGTEAPSAARAPLIMRPYDQELVTCQRYWEQTYAQVRWYSATAGEIVDTPVFWRVSKRTIPTLTLIAGSRNNVSAVSLQSPSESGARFDVTSTGNGDAFALQETVKADARL